MQLIISIVFSLLMITSSYAQPNQSQVLRVIDGDTVEITAEFLPKSLGQTLKLRLLGIDTPEKGHLAKCVLEDQRAQAATKFLQNLVSQHRDKIRVELVKWDKYGGRVLGHLYVDGQSVSQIMVDSGLAVRYNGAKKVSWCQ